MFGNLFGKKCRDHAIPVLEGSSSFDSLLQEDLVVLFKHSSACPVSWAAHAQMTRFLKANPGTPVRLVSVLKDRPLSQRIAAATGIPHESPQVIVLRRGEAVASASHGEITEQTLNEILTEARQRPCRL